MIVNDFVGFLHPVALLLPYNIFSRLSILLLLFCTQSFCAGRVCVGFFSSFFAHTILNAVCYLYWFLVLWCINCINIIFQYYAHLTAKQFLCFECANIVCWGFFSFGRIVMIFTFHSIFVHCHHQYIEFQRFYAIAFDSLLSFEWGWFSHIQFIVGSYLQRFFVAIFRNYW